MLHRVCARARADGQFSDDEVQALRAQLKLGRSPALLRADELRALAAQYEATATAIATRLDSAVAERALAPAAADRRAPEARPPRRVRASLRAGRRPGEPRELNIDEFTDAQRAEFGRRRDLMLHLEAGLTWREAAAKAGVMGSESAIKRMRRRYRKQGVLGLCDRRWLNSRPAMPAEVRECTEKWFVARPGADARALWTLIQRDCLAKGWQVPSYEWVKKYIADAIPALDLTRKGGMRMWERIAAPVAAYNPSTHSNHIWQIDHTRADIWIRVPGPHTGHWQPAEVWITAVLDVHSRAIMGYVASTRVPDAWTTALVLRRAIAPKPGDAWPMHGVPSVLVPDHGKDFMATAVASSVQALGIQLDPCPPYYPNMKGEIERWFGTMQRGLLATLPGYKKPHLKSAANAATRLDTLLTLPQLREELDRWITLAYHKRVHSGISTDVERTPERHWRETVRLRVADMRELNVLLLQSDKVRTVRNVGLQVTFKDAGPRTYWAPALADEYGTQVRIRYNPEDLESVLVYHAESRDFICEAWRTDGEAPRYSASDIVRERGRTRRGLAERLERYHEEVAREDRRRPHAWDSAHAEAERLRQAERWSEPATEAWDSDGHDDHRRDDPHAVPHADPHAGRPADRTARRAPTRAPAPPISPHDAPSTEAPSRTAPQRAVAAESGTAPASRANRGAKLTASLESTESDDVLSLLRYMERRDREA